MTDVYDWRGKPIEWEPDDVPGPTVEQLNAVIDSLNALVTRLQQECAAHEQALTMAEEENARLLARIRELQTRLDRRSRPLIDVLEEENL